MGKLSDFEQSFEQVWGGLKMLGRPAPGNHEYYAYTKHGDNEAAQNGTGANQGRYSGDPGNWHIISLNIECE